MAPNVGATVQSSADDGVDLQMRGERRDQEIRTSGEDDEKMARGPVLRQFFQRAWREARHNLFRDMLCRQSFHFLDRFTGEVGLIGV